MKFHDIHGSNIVLDDQKQTATRTASFCDAITFSDQPLKCNALVPLKIYSPASQWLGLLFIGVTTRDPNNFNGASLPKHIIGFCNEDDIWIKQIRSEWAGTRITLQLSSSGTVDISINNEVKFPFIIGLPLGTPLWLLMDLYGSTNCVQFATYHQPVSNDILILGPDMPAYKCGTDGVVPYNNAKVMIIGPTNSGKSSLKHALLNLNFEDAVNDYKMTISNTHSANNNGEWVTVNKSVFKEFYTGLSEKELYKNLAQNIVNEINWNDNEKLENMTPVCYPSSKDIVKSILRYSTRKIKRSFSKEVKQISEMNEFPEMLIEMVENLIKKQPKDDKKVNVESKENSIKFLLNICDFCGYTLLFLLHQFLLNSYAVYILTVDISEDLEAPLELSPNDSTVTELHKGDLTTINLIHQWLCAIHTLAGIGSRWTSNESGPQKDSNIQPKVILVGTHRNSVHLEPITRDQIVNETFDKIKQSLEEKPYAQHLDPKFFSIDLKDMSLDEPQIIKELRLAVQNVILQQKLIDFEIPVAWQEFEQILERLKRRGIFFADFNQLHEVARSKIDAFQSFEAFNAALHFYHNQRIIFCLDHIGLFSLSEPQTQSTFDSGIVILDPIWFVNCAYKLCKSIKCNIKDDSEAACCGILTDQIINYLWSDCIEQKLLLLGCLEKLDIICELRPYISIEEAPDVAATSIMSKIYFFPWISQIHPDNEHLQTLSESIQESSFKLVIEFDDLPVGIFSRLLVRLSRWSWNQGWGRKPEMYNSEGRIAVDFDHDLIVKICLKFGRIFLSIAKIFDGLQADQNECFGGPAANVCVKVQHLIETELENLQNTFYRRTMFRLVVPCPCDVVCETHGVESCTEDECLHFLSLNDCLTKKVIECQFAHQVRTVFVQRYFPHAPNSGIDDQGVLNYETSERGWDQLFLQVEPIWMREAAKMLAPNHPNRDWNALAKRLGYTDKDIAKLMDDMTPPLALLRDWYETNGRTRYCVDVLVSCLRMISREDIINIIEYDLEPEGSAPPIFISYHWDSQEQVLDLRRKLEIAGFPCWMDIAGFMGGGDSLYGKIYDGISRSKVVVCCLTPKYAASPICAREVTLADVLHKPILPVMLEQTPWPPPGPMAVIMSSIVYIDLCGVGGHGGIGKSGDSESRFRDILDRVSRYLAGYFDAPTMPPRYLQIPDIFSPIQDIHEVEQNQAVTSSPARAESAREEQTAEAGEPFQVVGAEVVEAVASESAFVPEAQADDESEMPAARHVHNRVTNCAICAIF